MFVQGYHVAQWQKCFAGFFHDRPKKIRKHFYCKKDNFALNTKKNGTGKGKRK